MERPYRSPRVAPTRSGSRLCIPRDPPRLRTQRLWSRGVVRIASIGHPREHLRSRARTLNPLARGYLVPPDANFLLRQRCAPMRSSRSGSVPWAHTVSMATVVPPAELRVGTSRTTSPAPCTGRPRYRGFPLAEPGECPRCRGWLHPHGHCPGLASQPSAVPRTTYHRVLAGQPAALGLRADPATSRRADDGMIQAARTRVFVDGNNVMGSRPDGWWRDRAGAARRLVTEIIPLARDRGGEWTIVFDGREPPRMPLSPECLTVVHTGRGRRDGADDRIVELVHEHPNRAASLVYTSDAKLRTRVHALGAQVAGARALLNEIAAVRAVVEQLGTGRSLDHPDGAATGNRVSADLPTTSTTDATSLEPL